MEVFLSAMENVTMKRFLSFTKRDATNEEWKKMEERKGYFDCILVEEFVRRSLPFREYICNCFFESVRKIGDFEKIDFEIIIGEDWLLFFIFYSRNNVLREEV